MSDRITDKTVIALPIPAFWALVVLLVVGTSISTAAFVSIKRDIAQISRDTITISQFREWQDEFRSANESTHLRVPPLRSTRSDAALNVPLAVIARKEP